MDLRPHPGLRGLAFTERRRFRAAGTVVVGLRGAVPVGAQAMPDRSSRNCAAGGSRIVVKGLNRLFDSPEIQAVVGSLPLHGRRDRCRSSSRQLWERCRPAPDRWRLGAAMTVLERAATSTAGERWGVYNIQRLYLEFLEALGHARGDGPGRPGATGVGLLPTGQVQPGDLGLRSRSTSTPRHSRSTGHSLAGSTTRRPVLRRADADVGYASPDAVVISTVHQAKGMQWPAVFVPCLRNNRFPAKGQGRV